MTWKKRVKRKLARKFEGKKASLITPRLPNSGRNKQGMPRNQLQKSKPRIRAGRSELERAVHDYLSEIEARPDPFGRVVKIYKLERYIHPEYGRIFYKLRTRLSRPTSAHGNAVSISQWIRREHPKILFAGSPEHALLRARRELERLIPEHFGSGGDGRPFSIIELKEHGVKEVRGAAFLAIGAIRRLRRARYHPQGEQAQGTLGDLLKAMFPGQYVERHAYRKLPARARDATNELNELAEKARGIAFEIHGIRCISFEQLRATDSGKWEILRRAHDTEPKLRFALRNLLDGYLIFHTDSRHAKFVSDLNAIKEHLRKFPDTNVSNLVGEKKLKRKVAVPIDVSDAAWRVRTHLKTMGEHAPSMGDLVWRIAKSSGIDIPSGSIGARKGKKSAS